MGVQIVLFPIEIDSPHVMRTVHGLLASQKEQQNVRYAYDIAVENENADKSDSSHSDVDIGNQVM